MNDRRPTELELAAGLRAHLPAMAPAGLRDGIQGAVATVPQQRPLPWVLGPLTDADPAARQRAVLLAVAIMAAVALAGVVAVGALFRDDRPPLPTGGMGRLAYVMGSDLFIADPDGSNPVRVAHADGADLGRPLWSPDGSRVAMQAPEPAIFVVDLQTGDLQRLTAGTLGSWSPDSDELSYFTTNGDIAALDVDTGTSRILAENSGNDSGFDSGWGDPLVWSPDGRWILDDEPRGDLLRIDAASGARQALHTDSEFYQYIPDWSPDSSRVVFGFIEDLRSSNTLWVVNADGSGTREIRTPDNGALYPDWSSDGEWIAYISSRGFRPPGRLMLVRPDGSESRSLADGVDRIVAWSPDGGSLAYRVRDSNDPELHTLHVISIADGTDRIVSVGGGLDVAFAPTAEPENGPTSGPSPPAIAEPSAEPPIDGPAAGPPVQPDGSWGGVAFRTQQGDFDCYVGVLRFPDRFTVVEPERDGPPPEGEGGSGAGPTQGPVQADSCELPFAPDGSAVARFSQRDKTVDVARMDGTLISGPFPADGPPIWSPGGGWLAMTGCGEVECRSSIMRRDGTNRRDLPGAPHWSPGDRVMAIAGPDGSLLVGPGDGSNLRSIGTFPLPGGWSPDGSAFVFVRDGDAWLARADGSGTRNLTEFELGGATRAFWSPDGRWILVMQGETARVFSPDGTTRQRLGTNFNVTDGSWGPDWAPAWSPDGTFVAIENGSEVALFRTSDWHAVRLTNAWQPAWSPDGRHLAVVSDDGNGAYQVDVANADGTGRVTVTSAISYPPIAWFR